MIQVDIGFQIIKTTDRATLWGCPMGEFWMKGLPRTSSASHRAPIIMTLEYAAREAASAINHGHVEVRVLEKTKGGGAKVSFSAIAFEHVFDGDGCDSQPKKKEKRAQVFIPASLLMEEDGKVLAPAFALNAKLKAAHDYRGGFEWKARTTKKTTYKEVFDWLLKVNAPAMRRDADRQFERNSIRLVCPEAESHSAQLMQKHKVPDLEMNKKFAEFYAPKIIQFIEERGAVEGIETHICSFDMAKAALATPDFVKWLRKQERSERSAAKSKPEATAQ